MDVIPLSDYLIHKRSGNTMRVIQTAIKNFCTYLNPDNPPQTTQDIEKQAAAFISLSNEEQFDLLKNYAIWLSRTRGSAPNTISSAFSSIYGYMEWNDKKLTTRQIKLIRSSVPRPITIHQDKPFTKEMIRSLISHADPLMRTIILIQASAGMRISEVLSLQLSDLHADASPRYFLIPYTRMKAGRPHKYRISEEAYNALGEWLKIRNTAAYRAEKRSEKSLGKPCKTQSDRIFPYAKSTISMKWSNILQAANLAEVDPNTKRYTLTPHSLRKWCESTLKRHIDKEIAEAIIGHDQGLSSAYRRYTEEDINQEYLKAEPYLTILAPDDYADMHGRTAAAINETNKSISYLTAQLAEMEERQKKTEMALKIYMGLMDRTEKTINAQPKN